MKAKLPLYVAIVVSMLASPIAFPVLAEDEAIPMWVSRAQQAYNGRSPNGSDAVAGMIHVRDAPGHVRRFFWVLRLIAHHRRADLISLPLSVEGANPTPSPAARRCPPLCRLQIDRHSGLHRLGDRQGDLEGRQAIPALSKGPTRGVTVDVATLFRDYLAAMEWDQTTCQPSPRRLKELGLGYLVT